MNFFSFSQNPPEAHLKITIPSLGSIVHISSTFLHKYCWSKPFKPWHALFLSSLLQVISSRNSVSAYISRNVLWNILPLWLCGTFCIISSVISICSVKASVTLEIRCGITDTILLSGSWTCSQPAYHFTGPSAQNETKLMPWDDHLILTGTWPAWMIFNWSYKKLTSSQK